jgi:hypothetical protein
MPSSLVTYPNEGEAGTAGAEAMGEDGEGGALLVPTTMMTTATKGRDKDKDMDANAVVYDNDDNNRHNQQGCSPPHERGGGR